MNNYSVVLLIKNMSFTTSKYVILQICRCLENFRPVQELPRPTRPDDGAKPVPTGSENPRQSPSERLYRKRLAQIPQLLLPTEFQLECTFHQV